MIGEDAITKKKTQLSRRGDMVVDEKSEASEELLTRLKQQDSRFKIQDSKEICENQYVEVQNETARIVGGITCALRGRYPNQ
ncbi:hypothetical protein V6N13_023082 [Hibiscus sabdariffa]|uniref:Uncharacterized protein n=1 Tax=Hibiscus sabdariffa TaxID=183260 RepID=A0ABR2BYG0_9ROSI